MSKLTAFVLVFGVSGALFRASAATPGSHPVCTIGTGTICTVSAAVPQNLLPPPPPDPGSPCPLGGLTALSPQSLLPPPPPDPGSPYPPGGLNALSAQSLLPPPPPDPGSPYPPGGAALQAA